MSDASRARSFDRAAARYAGSRPSYPPFVLDAVEEFLAHPLSGARAVDVGAGTGIATALLRERGAEVVAVEPGEDMAAQFRAGRPGLAVVRGDGNALPLRDGCLDLITYAQAWQWTDTDRSVPEALRVLRPGGVLAVWWNTTDFAVPWIADQHERIARFGGVPARSRARPDDAEAI
ncbi:MAG: class I SAM-dependent methyltransferase, partial [Streptomyces sp.]